MPPGVLLRIAAPAEPPLEHLARAVMHIRADGNMQNPVGKPLVTGLERQWLRLQECGHFVQLHHSLLVCSGAVCARCPVNGRGQLQVGFRVSGGGYRQVQICGNGRGPLDERPVTLGQPPAAQVQGVLEARRPRPAPGNPDERSGGPAGCLSCSQSWARSCPRTI